MPKLPDDLPVLFLPTLAYGKSNEHSLYPGTITLSAATLMQMWMEIGASVARAGVRKFMLFNAHGGQMNAMDIVIRDLREQHGLMAVSAHWYTLGLPAGHVQRPRAAPRHPCRRSGDLGDAGAGAAHTCTWTRPRPSAR